MPRRIRLAVLPVLVFVPISFAFASDSRRAATSDRAGSPTAPDDGKTGADRMRARLAALAIEADSTNPYFGDRGHRGGNRPGADMAIGAPERLNSS